MGSGTHPPDWTLCATAKVVRAYALDFSQPVEVTVRTEDMCQAVLEHYSGVDQSSGFESWATFRKLSDPANIGECQPASLRE